MPNVIILNNSTEKPEFFQPTFSLPNFNIEFESSTKKLLIKLQKQNIQTIIIYSPFNTAATIPIVQDIRRKFSYGKLSVVVIGNCAEGSTIDELYELEINDFIDYNTSQKLIQNKLQEIIIQSDKYHNLYNNFDSLVNQNKQMQHLLKEMNRFVNIQKTIIDNSNNCHQNYKQLFELMPIPLAYINIMDGTVQSINYKFAEVFGYTLNDGNNIQNWWQLAYPDETYRNNAIQQWTTAVENALLTNSEIKPDIYKITTKENKELLIEISGRIVNGHIVASFINLTENENIKNQLNESKILLSQIIESIPDPLFIKNTDHKWTMVNQSFSEFMGIPKENLIGKSDHDLFPEEQAYSFVNSDRLVFENGKSTTDDHHITIKNNQKRYISTKRALIKSNSNYDKNLVGIIRDLTEYEKSRHSILENEKKFRTIFENIQEVYLELDLVGKILEVSPSIQYFSSYKREDLIGKYDEDYFVCKEMSNELRQEIISRKRINDYELEVLDKDGAKIPCLVTSVLIEDANGKPYKIISSIRNITDRKKVEEELKKSQLLLNNKNNQLNKSLNYAQYIQSALLPDHETFKYLSFDYSVYYNPKDTVSGDFYYMESINDKLYVAVADCTGHGVPGAMLNMLGKAYLDEIIKHHNITQPNLILNFLRDKIKESLYSSSALSDGMDIALCVINWQTNIMQYSGANIPLYRCTKESENSPYELIKYKADRLPIGKHPKDYLNFTCKEIKLKYDDIIYIATDGYKSQFGGSRNETMKLYRFEKLIRNICKYPLIDQMQFLDDYLVGWKGTIPQVDDILILGLRIKSKEEIIDTFEELTKETEKFPFSVNNYEVDEQHKELFRIFSRLFKTYKNTPELLDYHDVLLQLKTYATNHFNTEEKYFSNDEYYKIELHIKQHEYFKNFISELLYSCDNKSNTISFELLCFLKDWIVKHVLGTDQKFREYFSKPIYTDNIAH